MFTALLETNAIITTVPFLAKPLLLLRLPLLVAVLRLLLLLLVLTAAAMDGNGSNVR